MEQRLANAWRMTLNEKKFIETALLSDLRIDGRGPFDYRDITVQFGSKDGSSEVQLGQTRVLGFVTSQLVQPYRDRPSEGTLAIFTEFSPMADPLFEVGRPGEISVELARIIDRGLRESRAVDTESLCVVAGKWVWSIRIDLHIIDNAGNLVDAANIAALAALLTFRRPDCRLGGEDDQDVIMHPPEVREPLPLIVHHLPIAITFAFIGNENAAVVDPSHFEEAVMGGKLTATLNANGDVCAIQKAGGVGVIQSAIMQCLRIASAKAADITATIKNAVDLYNTERALRKIKRHGDSVNISKAIWKEVDKIEDKRISRSGDQGSSSVDKKLKPFIGGPSIWDPYSKGIRGDELKSSLASRGAVKVNKIDISTAAGVEPQFSARVESVREADAAEEATLTKDRIKALTLKDAVKPKHKRRNNNNLSKPVGT